MNKHKKDNAVLFLDQMCSDGISFIDTCKQLGQFAAMVMFLRFFEKWLKGRPAENKEPVQQPITQVKTPAAPSPKGEICPACGQSWEGWRNHTNNIACSSCMPF